MALLTDTDLHRAREAQERVFATTEPLKPPFQSWVPARAILHGSPLHFEGSDLSAIVAAARSEGDSGFYVSVTYGRDYRDQDDDWYVPFDDLPAYAETNRGVENAIYSPRGRWGILTSFEHFSLVGGSEEFVHAVVRGYLLDGASATVEEHARWFLEEWKRLEEGGSDLSWLPVLLEHVLGPSRARAILDEHGRV